MKTIEQAIQAASDCLAEVGLDNARMESEFLVAAYLQKPRAHVLLHRSDPLGSEHVRPLQKWLRERERRKPLAYITGEQPFREWRLQVNPSVLIPRPETELLVEQALRTMDQMPRELTVVDVGTGSGAIALSLAGHPQVSRVIGIDCSLAALKVARANEKQVLGSKRIEWIQGDLLTPLQKRQERVDVVVANLPYITSDEMGTLDPELLWEPRLALEAGEDGLRLIRPCVSQAKELLSSGGTILLEIGYQQAVPVMEMLKCASGWKEIRMYRDFSGHPRIIQAWRAHG